MSSTSLIGLAGAVLPAVRATKLSIVDALRLAD
jgi:ABC-type antimicrobial peptide transport system permease subunit